MEGTPRGRSARVRCLFGLSGWTGTVSGHVLVDWFDRGCVTPVGGGSTPETRLDMLSPPDGRHRGKQGHDRSIFERFENTHRDGEPGAGSARSGNHSFRGRMGPVDAHQCGHNRDA